MSKKLSISEWCKKNGKEYIIEEFDSEKNKTLAYYNPTVDHIPYDYLGYAWWKCPEGHSYALSVVMRTKFNCGCIECDFNNGILPLGTSSGCLEIINRRIKKLDEVRCEYDVPVTYECKCRCGRILEIDSQDFVKKQHKYCDAIYGNVYSGVGACGIRLEAEEKRLEKAPRKKEGNYDKQLAFKIHESLIITGETYDQEEPYHYYHSKPTILGDDKRVKEYVIRKMHKCKCYLCGKEFSFKYGDFEIRSDDYGYKATYGYYSDAHCDCHKISSFQWRTIDILRKHGVDYRVEVSFHDLYGIEGKNKLRFDFGIYKDEKLNCLLECQGEQHYRPVKEFGGESVLSAQQQNDDIKRKYASSHGILLVEIPYTINTYVKEEEFLEQNGIIVKTEMSIDGEEKGK